MKFLPFINAHPEAFLHPKTIVRINFGKFSSNRSTLIRIYVFTVFILFQVFEETPINDAVSADMDKFMTQKYERIVLRPEINNSELQSAYLACIKEIHERYLQTISSIDRCPALNLFFGLKVYKTSLTSSF